MATKEDDMNELVNEARTLFRRGYAWLDALGSVGLSADDFPFDKHVTGADEAAHDRAWSM